MKHQAKLPTARTRQAVISLSSGDTELVIRNLNWMVEGCERIDQRLCGLATELRSRAARLRKIAAAVDDATVRR
jgi:hypothetical protein